jgi:glycerol-3-phosphate acyltransferase PlsX
VQARPEHLVQFAYLGACFREACVGIERPSVGLLSVGEESGKGTPEILAAHERLAEGTLNFAGNVEGFDLPRATVDVIVADGFAGNVALKVMEGRSPRACARVRCRAPAGC